MKVVSGYKFLKTIAKTNVSQIILVEKYGIKYVLKMAMHKEYNYLIEREYTILRYLFSIGIVPKPVAIGSIGTRFYFIREWIHGVTLGDFLKDKNEETVTEYFKETLYLLHKLHTSGIILRDISPENFFVDRNGKLYLLDAGFAILFKEKAELEGTPPYIAPESIGNNPIFSFKSDLYSIGALFYYLYTGNPPYEPKNLDDLAIQQQQGLPPMDKIPPLPRRLILQLMSSYDASRPSTLSAIKILNESPKIGQLLVEKKFPVIFSGNIEAIVKKITGEKKNDDDDSQIINVFQANYPEGFFSYIFKELTLRLELANYKTAANSYSPSADVIIWHSTGEDDFKEIIRKLRNDQKLVVFSRKPLKINPEEHKNTVYYMNINIREGELENRIEEVLSIRWSSTYSRDYPNLPLYARLNLKILEYVLPDDFPIYKDTLQTLADYLSSEYHDLMDLLSLFKFAMPKDRIYALLLDKTDDTFAKIKEKSYTSLLSLLELMGFVEITETHIVLLPGFDLYLRRNRMGKQLNHTHTIINIYDELEDILHTGTDTSLIYEKIKTLLQGKRLPPTHARIFLDRLYETIKDTETKVELLKTKISFGFWKSAIEDWEKLALEIDPKKDLMLFLDYARLSISLGKYNEAIRLLKNIDHPKANSLLLYAHALYTRFNEFKKVLKEKSPQKDDPYYHIAMGLFELSVNKNTTLAKNHAVRANELAEGNLHATMVGTYLYGISLLESGDTERAISILESITGHEEYGIEALLVNFHLGYIHYRRNEFLKAIYYFEYSYYMARELNNKPLSAQAAFYLSHMYHQNNKLDLAECYMDYAYKLSKMLSGEQRKYLFKNYLKLTVRMNHFDKALKFIENNPEAEKDCDLISLAHLYVAVGDEKKLKELRSKAQNKDQKAVIDVMLRILKEEKKQKEVHHD